VSLRTKLLLLVALGIAASVGAVAWLIEERAHEAFRLVEQERTGGLVGQFRREFEHEGDEIIRGVETIANSDSMLRMTTEITNGTDFANYMNEAAGYAAVQRLDFLDIVSPDGTIISSAHWPVRVGYKQRWFLDANVPLPQPAFLRHVETPQGTVLALLCLRAVHRNGLNYYLVGGRRLDAVIQVLSPPEGVRVSVYSVPEQGAPETLTITKGSLSKDAASNSAANKDGKDGSLKDNLDPNKFLATIQKAMAQGSEETTTVDWGPEMQMEEIIHVIPLPGYADAKPATLLVGNSLERELTLEKRIRNISLMIAGVGVFLGVVITGILTTRLSRPVKKLALAAAQVGQGNWDVRVDVKSKDEIGKLATAFNHMTEELMAQRERLVQTERVAAWRELARRLAHELKNPLFPLQITVENLLRARENTPEQFDEVFKESTTTLLAEIANLKTIIGRFSDFSKMPAPQLQAVDLDELVRNVVQLFQAQLARSTSKIEPVMQLGNPPAVSGDPVLLRRVIENLVLNAIDAMPQGGRLTFRTVADGKFATFEITDSGKGLTQEECDRLFTPYYTTKQHGTGLGLAIVQSVVSDHQGRITVSSTKDRGTTFHVELPLYAEASS